MNFDADITIIGAGVVGLTLACLLAQQQLNVTVVEAKSLADFNFSADHDVRVSAISKVTQRLLQIVNVWDDLVAHRVSSFDAIDVWDELSSATINFDSADAAISELGFIVENNLMQHVLQKKLKSFPNVTLITDTLKSYHENPDHLILQFQNHTPITTRLIIGADGANSMLRQLANIDVHERSYQQHALIATVKTSLPHLSKARQRFLAKGPLAFLPLSDPYLCSIVWSTSPEEAQQLKNLPAAEFNQTLAQAFQYTLGNVTVLEPRMVFPLTMRHAKHYVKSRLALVGDAAHTIHPLAGQGLNIGLLDAVTLAEVIIQAKQKNRDWGSIHTLKRYERWRKGHNWQMISLMDGFNQFFGSQNTWVQKIVPLGCDLMQRTAPLKNFIMRQAMGFSRDLPKILQ